MRPYFIFLSILVPFLAFAQEDEKENQPLPIGNFSIPTVTQVAPLASFGQLIIGKDAVLPQLYGCYSQNQHGYQSTIAPNVIYGIREDFSVLFYVPFDPASQSYESHSSGIEDILVQLEYGYYNKSQKDYTLQGTVVANVQFPTGSCTINPRTGNGSFSYFLGTTFAYLSYNWYAFLSPGVNLTTQQNRTKFGNAYLYQCGIARYIKQLSPPGWIFDLMVEFDGTYLEKDKIQGVIDPDSGGNSIFITPSIYLASERVLIQWGVSLPLIQELNGLQDKNKYSIVSTIGVAFQF